MRWLGPIAAGLAAGMVVAVGLLAWGFTVDDAYVVLRHAEHFVAGQGWAMNPGVPSDGVTGPLWIVPFAAGELLGADGMVVAKAVGLACGALATWLVVREVSEQAQGDLAAPVAAGILGVQPTLAIWSVAGLETGAATLAITAAALGWMRRAPIVVGVATAAVAWLRPELLAACGVLLIASVARDRGRGALAIAAAGVAGVVVFRLALFGHVLPLALDAKPGSIGWGAQYVLLGIVVITGLGGVLGAAFGVRPRAVHVLAVALVTHAVAVLIAGGDWMPGFRLLAPVLPIYAMLAAWGIVALARARGVRGAGAALCLATAMLAPGLDLTAQLPEVRDAGERREREGAALARWLRRRAASVALVDVGYLGWASGVRVIDLGGITDAEVARMPGGHLGKQIDPGWLAARAPDAIVLHAVSPPEIGPGGTLHGFLSSPVEMQVAQMPWVRAHFRVEHVVSYAPGYWYVVLCHNPG